MAAKAFKDCVLDELSAITWSTISADNFRDQSMEAVATGIHTYLTNKDNVVLTIPTVGMVAVVPTPLPFAGTVAGSLDYSPFPVATIKSLLLAQTTGGVLGFFSVLSSIVASVITSVTGWDPTSQGSAASGIGVTAFPAMVAQGPLAYAKMSTDKPDNKEDAWALLQDFVVLGLTGGIITIPSIIGVTTVPPGAYASTVNPPGIALYS